MRKILAMLAALAVVPSGSPPGRNASIVSIDPAAIRVEVLARHNAVLRAEADLAGAGVAYAVIDPSRRTVDFRIRGRTMKTYSLLGLAGAAPRSPRRGVVVGVGAGAELVPPDPRAGRMSALLIQDPGSASGPRRLVPIETDAGLLGVEAPPAFAVRLDGGIQLHVTDRADHSAAGFSLIADPGTARRLYFSFAPGVHVLLLPPAASGAGRWREARTGG